MLIWLEDGSLFKVLEVKNIVKCNKSIKVGWDCLLADTFARGEIMTIFVRKVIEQNVDNIYAIINNLMVLDAKPWCEMDGYVKETYPGAHMVDDPNCGEDNHEDSAHDEINTKVSNRFEFYLTKAIKSGDELLFEYIITNY